jgi:ribosomal protein S18 acetylase RimI-like enzyme
VIETSLYPPPIRAHGLVLRPWDLDLARQVGQWGTRGFPYHAFDMDHLRDVARAEAMVTRMREDLQHRHFVADEDGVAVGRVSVNLRDEAGLYIWSVHVAPEHEGRGVCRRMLAGLIEWLERSQPARDFVLSSNTFAEHAHRAYFALGFRIVETRWHFDRDIAERLWRVSPSERETISRHIRFQSGRWEVRTHVMQRPRGAPMDAGAGPAVAARRG